MSTPKAKFAGLALIAVLCAGFTLGLTACTDEAHFNAGVAAYKRGDYATVIPEWRPLAEQGVANAQFSLGVMYGKGQGVPRDYARAPMWYNLAASRLPPRRHPLSRQPTESRAWIGAWRIC